MVHSGFLEALNSVLPRVITATNSLNPGPTNLVYVTGHSKGGGMAAHSGIPDAARVRHFHQAGMTFAAPRSGDGGFKPVTNRFSKTIYGTRITET